MMTDKYEIALKYADKAISDMLNKCCAEGINPMGAITAMCSASALTAGGLHNKFVRDNEADVDFFIEHILKKPFLNGKENISILIASGDGLNQIIAIDKTNKATKH